MWSCNEALFLTGNKIGLSNSIELIIEQIDYSIFVNTD